MNEDIIGIAGLFTTMIVLGLGIPLIRIWAKSKERAAQLPPVDAERERRLERIEHAVETMAVEIERISEGQRYVTKLLTDRARAAGELPAGKQ